MTARFSRDEMMAMDPLMLRTHLRERVHHTVEHQLYSAIYAGRELGPTVGQTVREILGICEARGLSRDLPEVRWANRLLALAEQVGRGEPVDPDDASLPAPLDEEGMKVWRKVLFGRRSYRHWDDRPVPASMVEQMLEACMWAANGCNMQVWRFIVIEDPDVLQKFANLEFEVERVKIVCCTDLRGYRDRLGEPPTKNRLLDVGAGMQNMCLMAHALGLGACWSTFSPKQIQGIREHFNLPRYIDVVTYLSLGWPAEKVIPPARMSFRDALLSWDGREAFPAPVRSY